VMTEWKTPLRAITVGTGRKVASGNDIAVLTIGPIGNEALKAKQQLEEINISAAVYDMRFVKPIDEMLLHEVFSKFSQVITVEDGCIQGGMGTAVLEFMADNGYMAHVVRLGIPDRLVEHGTQEELYAECGYDAPAIVAQAKQMMAERPQKIKAVS